jgi:mono/diheme cytochrome c family protein
MSKRTFVFVFVVVLVLAISLAACGSKSAATQAAPPSSGGTASFASDVQPIFQSNCVGCHSGGGSSAGLDLSSYDSVMKGSGRGPVVSAGSADSSRLVLMVESGQMPRGGPKLSSDQIQKIKDWINSGAQNN